MAFIHGHATLMQVALGFVFVLFRVLAAMETNDIEVILAQTVSDALDSAHIDRKNAGICMKVDESQLSKQLRGERGHHISLTRLIRLPFAFWLFFAPALIAVVYRKRMREMAEVLNDVRTKS